MVRINLINPKYLADQHLIAEYNEILMLLGYVRKYPDIKRIPEKFKLHQGHVLFFKNKLVYLQKRHNEIKKEMMRRKFKANKTVTLSKFPKNLKHDWRPDSDDKKVIKNRLKEKIRLKPDYYRYHGEKKKKAFFLRMIDSA